MTARAQALKAIAAYGFALDDALLYLDTHPCDAQALMYYQEQQEAYRAAKQAYVQCYGPLQMDDAAGTMHLWTETPWPWEGVD